MNIHSIEFSLLMDLFIQIGFDMIFELWTLYAHICHNKVLSKVK